MHLEPIDVDGTDWLKEPYDLTDIDDIVDLTNEHPIRPARIKVEATRKEHTTYLEARTQNSGPPSSIQIPSEAFRKPKRAAQALPARDTPLYKRPRTSTPGQPNDYRNSTRPTASGSRTPMTPPVAGPSKTPGKRDVIEISSDDDEEERNVPSKKAMLREETDSEEEYATCILDVNDARLWIPPLRTNDEKYNTSVQALANLTIEEPDCTPDPHYTYPDISARTYASRSEYTSKSSNSPEMSWDCPLDWQPPEKIGWGWASDAWAAIRDTPASLRGTQAVHRAYRGGARLPHDSRHRGQLRLTGDIPQCSGSINRIIQNKGRIAICSATVGGHADSPDEEEDVYNRPDTLMEYRNSITVKLPGHQAKKSKNTDTDGGGSSYMKHYTVNDIKYDPNSQYLVSTGNDKKLITWEFKNGEYKSVYCHEYNHVPHDMVFKPNSDKSTLAVAEKNVSIHSSIESGPSGVLRLFRRHGKISSTHHTAGSIMWGHGCTSDLLFASTEPLNDRNDGIHQVFDVGPEKCLYAFKDATEAGDAMAVDSQGSKLALLTHGEDTNVLRVYDIAHKDPKAVDQITLDRFAGNSSTSLEINFATFSPDGIYLALARNDNHVHLYDSRMLGRGVLYDFEHWGKSQISPNHDQFGVVHAEWVETRSRKLQLITGGNDGCVRLWDPLVSIDESSNGTVLAKAPSDIGYFSLGVRADGEHDLIVGDSCGRVFIYDSQGEPFR